jgi:hypothetical protein
VNGKNNSLLAQNARRILDLALESDHGIEVLVEVTGDLTSPGLRAKQVLYRFKKENDSYASLRIFQHPNNDLLLWVTKQDVDTHSFSFDGDQSAENL